MRRRAPSVRSRLASAVVTTAIFATIGAGVACKSLPQKPASEVKDLLIAPDDHFVLLYSQKATNQVCLAQCSPELYDSLQDLVDKPDVLAGRKFCAADSYCMDRPQFLKKWLGIQTSMTTLKARMLGNIAEESLTVINPFPTLAGEQVAGWERLNAGITDLEAEFRRSGDRVRIENEAELLVQAAAKKKEDIAMRQEASQTRWEKFLARLRERGARISDTEAAELRDKNFWDLRPGIYRRVDANPSCLMTVTVELDEGLTGRVSLKNTFGAAAAPTACFVAERTFHCSAEAEIAFAQDAKTWIACKEAEHGYQRYLVIHGPNDFEFRQYGNDRDMSVTFSPFDRAKKAAAVDSFGPQILCNMTTLPLSTIKGGNHELLSDARQKGILEHQRQVLKRGFFEGEIRETLEEALISACEVCLTGSAKFLASITSVEKVDGYSLTCANPTCYDVKTDRQLRSDVDGFWYKYRDSMAFEANIRDKFFRRCSYHPSYSSSIREAPAWTVDTKGELKFYRDLAWWAQRNRRN